MARVHGVQPNDPKTDLAKMYTDWNKRVIETVPAEKLLIFNVKEEWKPLYDFLGVPVPDKPFPRVNSTEEFKEWRAEFQRKITGMQKGAVQRGLKQVLLASILSSFGYFLLKFLLA
jgi:hypothetical protein